MPVGIMPEQRAPVRIIRNLEHRRQMVLTKEGQDFPHMLGGNEIRVDEDGVGSLGGDGGEYSVKCLLTVCIDDVVDQQRQSERLRRFSLPVERGVFMQGTR